MMVLQHERAAVSQGVEEARVGKPFWVRWDFWSFLVAAVVIFSMLFLVLDSGPQDRVQEMMPEHEVDTLAVPEVAAVTGGPVETQLRYVGSSDANFDPDTPLWWMPEYEVDTATNPEVAARTGGPFVTPFHYVGSSDANFDPDV